jgi:integrase/recombinase XerD
MPKKGHRKNNAPIGDASDPNGMQRLITEHIEFLEVRNYSSDTINQREKYLRWFAIWCAERSLTKPSEITKPILERYQRHLYLYRNEKDQPMSFRSQYQHLSHVKAWYKWLARENRVLYNPASELEMPKVGKRLPKAILSAKEVEVILAKPDLNDPIGIRDRAILEVFYSCGIRRRELANLQLYDVDADRQTLTVRQGKGKKDRIVPIGKRALQWIDRYLSESRPFLLVKQNEQTLFLSQLGMALEPDSLTEYVRQYVASADIGKKGSCHMFRHTMATLMLENGADIRYIQAMLGHAELSTTQIYTHVAIRKLQKVHSLTHPADNPKPDEENEEIEGIESRSDAKPPMSEESQA